ncbi:hypothetical protein C8A01DRAFT_20958 [Parachaetomium inaequale]|uniref:Uncharacterized protein n=1 Tax=Parachaetomium inaequale TaxID=2588326 RepID=A0AAN6P576_9PEZI|nr:hypothetical protein C8A01DRAFT_20958 [Parachaetomium inaequale]
MQDWNDQQGNDTFAGIDLDAGDGSIWAGTIFEAPQTSDGENSDVFRASESVAAPVPQPSRALPQVPDLGQDFVGAFDLDQALADLNHYPVDPLLGQDNGANQAVIGQGASPAPRLKYNLAYGNPVYATSPPQPLYATPGLLPYGQPLAPQNPGYPPRNMPGQGYPMAYNPQVPVANPPAYPPPPNQALNGPKLVHNRKKTRKGSPSNDPAQFYHRRTGLRSWGPMVAGHDDQEVHLFRYYKHTAELRPQLRFTKEELVTFFRGNGHPNPCRNLTLWIQNVPAQVNQRYPNAGDSSKCRYKDCPGPNNTILKGYYRVAFDEFSDMTGTVLDPFHNAGYMHLHCFETAFDLGYLLHYGAARHGFSILPDRRNFAMEERNPASLLRDRAGMITTYNQWVEGQRARADQIERSNAARPAGQQYTGFAPQTILPHAQRLGRALTAKHLAGQVEARGKAREKNQNNAHIGLYMGDLALHRQLNQQRKRRKRARDEDDEDEDGDYNGDNDADKDSDGPSSPAPKRVKREHTPAGPSSDNRYQAASPMMTRGRKRSLAEADANPPTATAKRTKLFHASPSPAPSAGAANIKAQPDSDSDSGDMLMDFSFDDGVPNPATSDSDIYYTCNEDGGGIYTSAEEDNNNPTAAIVEQLTAQPHLTRASAHAIQSRLGGQPAHVRSQVRAAVPEAVAALVLPPPHENQGLAARISQLGQRERREVELAVARREKQGEKRKIQSL